MLRLALLASLIALPVNASCIHRDMIVAWLVAEQNVKLTTWGLADNGNMLELFTGPAGRFAVVETSPQMCGTIVALPHKTHGRLAVPELREKPLGNPVNPRAMPGHPL